MKLIGVQVYLLGDEEAGSSEGNVGRLKIEDHLLIG